MPKVDRLSEGNDRDNSSSEEGPALALNIADALRIADTVRQILLVGKLDQTQVIMTDKKRPDEAAALFTCDLLTAACICDTIRDLDRRAKEYTTRVYIRRTTVWEKLPRDIQLSVVIGDDLVLNPQIFSQQSANIVDSPPPLRRVF